MQLNIERLWEPGSRDESVTDSLGNRWLVSDMIHAVKDEEPFELPLAHINLNAHKFNCEDLYEFAQHARHVNESNPDVPIIMDERGRPIDGRHRIVKALLEGRKFILCKRIPQGTKPTTYG